MAFIKRHSMDLPVDIVSIRIILSLSMLFIVSVWDIYKREVHDGIWIIFGVIAGILVFLEPEFDQTIIQIGISLIIAPIALMLWRTGMFGGADAFCLIVLAGLAPQITLTENFVTPITVLTNAAILSIIILIINFARNLIAMSNNNIFEGFNESKLRKTYAMFIGYKAKNPKHSFSIEQTQDNVKKLNFSLHHAENDEFCNTKNTWVTPGIPYLLYITGGFVIQLIFGDLIINFMIKIFM